MFCPKKKILLAASLLLASAQGYAAPYVLYSEDWSGDINWNSFSLDLGLNDYLIDGKTSAGDGAGFDFDSFTFTVPTGTQVTAIGYQIFAVDPSIPYNFSTDTNADRFGLGMDSADAGSFGTWEIDVVQVLLDGGSTSIPLPLDAPLGAGTHQFNPYYWTSGSGYGGWTYGISLRLVEATVTPPPSVPVPAAAWLFVSGLGGLAAVARRRSGSASKTL